MPALQISLLVSPAKGTERTAGRSCSPTREEELDLEIETSVEQMRLANAELEESSPRANEWLLQEGGALTREKASDCMRGGPRGDCELKLVDRSGRIYLQI